MATPEPCILRCLCSLPGLLVLLSTLPGSAHTFSLAAGSLAVSLGSHGLDCLLLCLYTFAIPCSVMDMLFVAFCVASSLPAWFFSSTHSTTSPPPSQTCCCLGSILYMLPPALGHSFGHLCERYLCRFPDRRCLPSMSCQRRTVVLVTALLIREDARRLRACRLPRHSLRAPRRSLTTTSLL